MRIKPLEAFLFLVPFGVAIYLSGCMAAAATDARKPSVTAAAEEITAAPSLIPSITSASTRTPVSIAALQTPLSSSAADLSLPDLLFSVTRASRYACMTPGSAEIWLAAYPYTAPKALLRSSEADYLYPSWSPDGQWIAYVESKPEIIPEDKLAQPLKISGADTVWVIRPDGSERRQVSEPFPSAVFSHLMGINVACDDLAFINSVLEWSPDGNDLVFVQSSLGSGMKWTHTYYLTDINTGKTQELFSQSRLAKVLWLPQNHQLLIQSDTEAFHQIDIQDVDHVQVQERTFALPAEANNELSNYEFQTIDQPGYLYGIFEYENTNYQKDFDERVAIWKLDLASDHWENVIQLPVKDWYKTQILTDRVITCDAATKKIGFLDPLNWTMNDGMQLPFNLNFICNFQEFVDETGNTWGLFEGSTDETGLGLWAVPLRPDKESEPRLLLPYTFILGEVSDVSYFAFQPQ